MPSRQSELLPNLRGRAKKSSRECKDENSVQSASWQSCGRGHTIWAFTNELKFERPYSTRCSFQTTAVCLEYLYKHVQSHFRSTRDELAFMFLLNERGCKLNPGQRKPLLGTASCAATRWADD
ncbi:uncharacterized [Tachysurus ichikawai]